MTGHAMCLWRKKMSHIVGLVGVETACAYKHAEEGGLTRDL